MPYINRFLGSANGAITFTGNTFGLSKQNNVNAPGTAHSIGTFFSANASSVDGTYPIGTTADWQQNASSAILRLPSTTTRILYAELIWGGLYTSTDENVSAFINNSITFRTPSGSFTINPDTATRSTLTASPNLFYVRSANVTNLITTPGTYTALGVPGTQGNRDNTLNSAGWTLAVVYEDPLQRSRNLSLFVGAELTSGTGSTTATVSGFGTPITGTVNGRLLVSSIEGDSIITGDQLLFGPSASTLQAVSGPNNPITNFFASQINNDAGILDTSGTFGNVNHPIGTNISGARQGWDITNIDVSSRLQNNQSTAAVRGSTNGDTYVINSLGLQIDINAPVFTINKAASESSAGTGELITYTVTVQNTGTADANLVVATDALSDATDFVPNSLFINGIQQQNINIQSGISLGTVGINETVTLTYQVQVSGPLTNVSELSNQVFIEYQFESTPGNTMMGSSASTINRVTAINTPPTVPDYTVTNPEDMPAVGQVIGTDVDGNPLTYQLEAAPANGNVSVNPNGQFVYTPNENFNGTDTFTVLVSDGQGGTAISTVTIIITPVNDGPVTQNYAVQTTEDTPLTGQVFATDADGNLLTFSLKDAPINGIAIVNEDGTYTYTPNPNFSGTDQFTVLVNDGQGGTAFSIITVTVTPVNDPPVVPDYAFTTQEDASVVGAVVAVDPDQNLLSYSLQAAPANGIAAVNVNGTFIYTPNPNFNGTDVFTVLVIDGQGGTAISTVTITVLPINDPPITGNLSFVINEDTTLFNRVTATDPDGNPLTFSLQNAPTNGVVVVNTDGTFTYTPNLNFNGTDVFTVLVSDGQGGAATSTVTITVRPVNDPPTVPNYAFTTQEDAAVVGTIVGSDVEGNPLTYSLQTQASNGVAIVNVDGTFTYTPNVNFNGTDVFRVLVSDDQGGTAVSTVTISVLSVNDPPITGDLFFTIAEDSTLTGQVTATDVEGSPLTYSLQNSSVNGTTIVNEDGTFTYVPNLNYNGSDQFTVLVSDGQGGTAVSTVNIIINPVNDGPVIPNYSFSTQEDAAIVANVVATDAEGNPLTYTLQTQAANGVSIVNADGTFTYTPNPNFNGTDVFTVLVSDGQGGTAVSTVTITVLPVNDPPVTSDLTFTINEDTTLSSQVVGFDPEGNSLIYTLQNPAVNGSAIVNADGTFTYTPNLNFNGIDVFTVLVSDGQGGTAVSTVNITIVPVNDPPTVPDYTFSTQEDASITGVIVGVDEDGNPLTYTLQTQATNGVSVVNADGTFTYTPNQNFNGTDVFTVLVSDGEGGTVVSTVTINVFPINDPPITSDLTFTINEDTTLSSQVVGFDPEGGSLTYTLQTQVANGVAVVNADGTFTYTPNQNFNGTDVLTVLVSDDQGGIAVSTVNITIVPVNDPPTVPDYTFSMQEDASITGVVVGVDEEGNPLTYTLQTQATNGVAVVNTDGTFTYTPNQNFNGTDVFTVLVSDGQGGTAVSTVTINVLPVNDSPVTSDLFFTIAEDTGISSQVVAFDAEGNPLIYALQNPALNGTAVVNADGTFTYTPNQNFNGTDVFTVLVSDDQGGTAVSTVNITIVPVNDPPTVPDYTFSTQEDASITGVVVGVDEEGNPLTYTLQTQAANGVAVVNADGTFTYTPNLNFNGTDVFTVLVSDGEGGAAVSTVIINVLPLNDPPVTSDLTFTINEDTTISSQVVGFDPEGGSLTYTLQTQAANGVAVVNADGTFTYTPNQNFNGTDVFTVLVSDDQGGTAVSTVNVTIVPVNDPPTVPDYTFSTQEDASVTGVVVGVDVDGNPLTYTLQTQAANGVAVVNADGTFTYTPNQNFNGTDVFTVLVSDGQEGTAVSTITINVQPVNDPPVTVNLAFTINEDTILSNQVPASDAEGDPVTFSLQNTPANGTAVVNADGTFTYTPNFNYNGTDIFSVLVSDSQGGTAVSIITITILPVNDPPIVQDDTITTTVNIPIFSAIPASDPEENPLTYAINQPASNGAVVLNSDGTYTYTPSPGYIGGDVFTVGVTDSEGATVLSTITVTILATNGNTVAQNAQLTTPEEIPLPGQVVATNVFGNALVYTLQDPPLFGTVTLNSSTGEFTYTPIQNFNGNDAFTVFVTDNEGGNAASSQVIIVTPVNDAPVVPNYQITTNEDTAISSKVIATDVDGNVLTYSLLVSPTSGSAVVNPDGVYTYTPNIDFNGTDTFTVLIDDNQGGTATSIITVTVVPVNDPPIGPNDLSFTTNEDTTLSGQVIATDPDGEVLTYTLEDAPTNGTAVVNADGTFTYTPNLNYNGADTFTVRTSDPAGVFIITNVFVTIVPVNDPPTVPNYAYTINEDTALSSAVVGTDLDGDLLTYEIVMLPTNGTVVVDVTGTFVYTPNLDFNGTDAFSVLVDDGQGGTATSIITVTVVPVNDPPVGPNDLTFTTNEDTILSGQVIATDPDGEVLSYTLEDAPTNGTAVVNADGTFTYTPNLNYNGADTFTVRTSDPAGVFIITNVFVTIVPVNDPPTVPNYAYTINEDTALSSAVVGTDLDGDLLTYEIVMLPTNGTVVVDVTGTFVYTPNLDFNGTDAFSVLVDDGQGGTATSIITVTVVPVNDPPVGPNDLSFTTNEDTTLSGQVIATDPDGEVLSYTLEDAPTNGTAVVNADGTFTYTPNLNYNGMDSFTVRISDSSGAFIITNVMVNVIPVNDPPTVPNYAYTINEDTALSSAVVGTDLDGDLLTYEIVTLPTNGTVVVDVTGTFVYTPNLDFNGTDAFSVLVDDGQGGTATSIITVTVVPVNDPPVGPNDLTFTTNEDTTLSGQVIATDPDGEVLTYTLEDAPTNGTAVVNADGTFTYTPNFNYNGMDSFTVRISDPSGVFIITNVMVTVIPVNDPPTVPNYAYTINEDTVLNSTVVGTDEDGDPLTYSLASPPANGTVLLNADGTFTYTPTADFYGQDNFFVNVQDSNGSTAISEIVITVVPVNDPPIAPNLITVITNEDTAVSGVVNAIDSDGNPLTYVIENVPINGVAVVNLDGTFVYTPNPNFTGTDTFTVRITDSLGAFIIVNVQVVVNPVEDAPTVPDYQFSINEDTVLSNRVVGTDVDGDLLTYSLLSPPVSGIAVVNSDGTFTYTPNPNFNGTDNFFVLVTDPSGGQAVSTIIISVLPVNDPPIAPNVIEVVTNEETLVISSVNAVDPDGEALIYTLEDAPTNGNAVVDLQGSFLYTPNANYTGADTFTIRVTDTTGNFIIVNVNVTVVPVNDPPTVPNYQYTILEDTILLNQVVATDVDGNPLTYSLAYQGSNGVATVNPDGSFTYIPSLNFVGEDNFGVTVSDGQGSTALSIITITVTPVDDPPIAPNEIMISTPEETPVTSQIVATDPEGLPLTYAIEDVPLNGTVTIDNKGVFTYTPNENFTGGDTFTVRITDSGGNFIITNILVTVIPVEQPPIVPNYSITTLQNQTVTGQIMGMDPNGDSIVYSLGQPALNGTVTISSDGTFIYTPNTDYVGNDLFTVVLEDTLGLTATSIVNVTVTSVNRAPITNDFTIDTLENTPINGQTPGFDPDGNPITYSVSGPPFNGTVTVDSVTGEYTYTPNPGFVGVDSFIIELQDTAGGVANSAATVNVISTNRPPTVNDLSIATQQGTSATGQLVGTDLDGDPIRFRLNLAPLYGSVVVNSNGIFTYIPNIGYVGDDNFSVIVEDTRGGQGFGTVDVTITLPNNPPFTVLGENITTFVNQPVNGEISANDPEGNIVSYQLGAPPFNGTAVINQDGTFTYAPNLDFIGEDIFDTIVKDSNGTQGIGTVIVTVLAASSVILTMDSEVSSEFNTLIEGQVMAFSTTGLPLLYMLQAPAQNGAVVVNADGTYTYQPTNGFFGLDEFTVLITDSEGNTASSTVVIVVEGPVAQQPIVTDQTIQTIEEQPVSGTVIATDPNGQPLTYTLLGSGATNGTVVLNQDGTFTYTPNAGFVGNDAFSVLVENPQGLNATTTVAVVVTSLLNQVVAENLTIRTLLDQPATGQIIARDQLGRPLIYSLNTSSLYGTAVVNPDGSILYTPNAEFSGQDQFSVLVVNDQGDQAISQVTVVVDNPASTITVPDTTIQTVQNQSVQGIVLASDSQGRPLRYSQGSMPENGTVVVNPDGTFTYTPNPQFFGTDSFTVFVQNDRGDSASGVVRVIIEELQSEITVEPLTVSGQQNQPVSGQVVATDVLGRPLTYAVSIGPANGTVVFSPDGTFTYTSNPNFAGIDSFTVTIRNDLGDSVTVVVSVVITNVASELTADNQNVTVVAGQVLQGQIVASDSQDRPLTYALATSPASGTVVVTASGAYTYTPNLGFVGRDQFIVVVRNDLGQQAFSVVTVEVTPAANVITANNVTLQTTSGTPVTGLFTASDTQGRPLTYTIRTVPTSGRVTLGANGQFLYTPNGNFVGTDAFSVLIVDDTGAAATAIATIIVGAVQPDAPIIKNQTFTLNVNETIQAQIVARDPQRLPLVYRIVTPPQNGVASIDLITGVITYTPNSNFVGTDSVVVSVTNSAGQTSTATITFTIQRGISFRCSIIF